MRVGQIELKKKRTDEFRAFLKGGPIVRNYFTLEPSSYAAEFAGRPGGQPTFENNLNFHNAFENDAPIGFFVFPDEILPQLKWDRKLLERREDETLYEETLRIPSGTKRRIVAECKGTIPWIVKAAVQGYDDFDLIDYYAEQIQANAGQYASKFLSKFADFKSQGWMIIMPLLTAFEAYYLIAYPDMPLFYYDHRDRYLESIRKVHQANLAVALELSKTGCELFGMGSAGLELLSPRIFDEAIIPFVRETTDYIRKLNCFSVYHICGHSYQLLKSGRINELKPTWFETFSSPPCGNNENLSESLKLLDTEIVSKGNLALETLRNATPAEIKDAVKKIKKASRGRRHIIGQADGTILSGTPAENIRAFTEAAAAQEI